jgi:hypothetical protein
LGKFALYVSGRRLEYVKALRRAAIRIERAWKVIPL